MAHAILLTARAAGAIGVILVTGDDCRRVVWEIASESRVRDLPVGKFARAALRDSRGDSLDDALVVRTAEDRWEVHVHGGTAVVDAVLGRLAELGATVISLADAGELLGKDHELQLALAKAQTKTALRLLLAQGRTWGAWTGHWESYLRRGQPLWPLHAAAQWVLHRSEALARLLIPARVAIVGPPNAGKSTLANALLGRPMSITSDQAGTTRDWVDAQAIFAAGDVQVPVTLVDTAGVRVTADDLEHASIQRTHDQVRQADVIIFLWDATRAPGPEDFALLAGFGDRQLIVAYNKCDAASGELPCPLLSPDPIRVSARTHEGLERLMGAVIRQLGLADVGEAPFAFTLRQVLVLEGLSLCDDAAECQRWLRQLA